MYDLIGDIHGHCDELRDLLAQLGYALQTDPLECDVPLDDAVRDAARPYPADEKPVFVGHYWLYAERPAILAPNVACVDYSVAKGGMLCAYRWSGEPVLNNDNFVTVRAI